jgi:hypothetical protein
MKILFLSNLAGQFSGLCDAKNIDSQLSCSAIGLSYPLNLLKELAEHAEVQIYSPPLLQTIEYDSAPVKYPFLRLRKQKAIIPATTNVEVLSDSINPDVIIQYTESIFPFLMNFEKAKCLRVLWFINGPNAAVMDAPVRKFIESKGADLVIKSVDKSDKLVTSQELKDLGTKVVWLPFSIDEERFRNKTLKRIWDVANIGNLNPYIYLLRVKIYEFLLHQKISFYNSEAFGEQYVDAINQSKIFFTCTGKYRYPIMKFYEVPACRTLLASDEPIDAENLGFKSGENYVSLEKAWYPNVSAPQYPNVESEWTFNEKEFGDLLTYYLNSDEERERIAKNGEELIRRRHTDKIRAKELFLCLQNHVRRASR